MTTFEELAVAALNAWNNVEGMLKWPDHFPEGSREGWRRVVTAIRSVPINMILYCPACGRQHIDEPHGAWTNPPHRSHQCQSCGCIWRPADVATNGVEQINTIGKADTFVPMRTERTLK